MQKKKTAPRYAVVDHEYSDDPIYGNSIPDLLKEIEGELDGSRAYTVHVYELKESHRFEMPPRPRGVWRKL